MSGGPDARAGAAGAAGAAGGVIVVGSINVDVTAASSRLPAPGETIVGTSFTLALGGKGANQAVAAALAGTSTRFVGCVGDDIFAPMLRDGLVGFGVDTSQLHAVPGPSGVAHIRVDAHGENDIVIIPLANAQLTTDLVAAAFAAGPPPAVLLGQLEIPWPLTRFAIEQARAVGATVVLDPAPAAVLEDSIWPLIDIVTPNETEALMLTGVRATDAATARAAGDWFVARGVRFALITLAGAGAVLVSAEGVQEFAAFPVTPVDSTAAGDTFAGYLGAGLAAGLSITDATSRAMAAGAISVTRAGATPSIPTASEVAALLASA